MTNHKTTTVLSNPRQWIGDMLYEINPLTNDYELFTGIAEYYFEDGQLQERANFIAGKFDGLRERYSENGQLIFSVNFKAGDIPEEEEEE